MHDIVKVKTEKTNNINDLHIAQISGESLCLLTGLTDRRHRQLAKSGHFPPPIKGEYQRDATLAGLFKFYREMGERSRNRKDKIDDEKLRKLQLENDESEGRMTDTYKLAERVAPSLIAFRDAIYAKLEQEA